MAKNKDKKIGLGLSSLITIIVLLISILGAYYSIKNLKFGLDLQGGFEVLYEVNSIDGSKVTPEMVESTYKIIDKRINVLGVSEPEISIENNNIRVTMAGVDNIDEARKTISTTAALTFRTIDGELLADSSVLDTVGVDYQTKGGYVLTFKIKDYDKFYALTKKVSEMEDNRMVIWLDYVEGTEITKVVVKTNEIDPKTKKPKTTIMDGYFDTVTTINEDGEEVVEKADAHVCGDLKKSNCLSVASVGQAFSQDVILRGNFTKADAEELKDLINSGSMPTKLKEISSKTVTASFGEGSLDKTFKAGVIGIAAIAVLLILIYRVSGLIASISILAYTFLTLLLFNLVGGRLTLQGIAALVIGIGMAVDSAVILYSRIKEELNKKMSLKTAYEKGSKESFISILDANVTTLIAAIILFKFGESSVKGFATMLIISILVTFIVMVYLNKYLIKLFAQSPKFENHKGLFIGFKERKNRVFNFVKPRFVVFAIVGLILIVGGFFTYSEGLNLGIDFKGGSTIEINSKNNLKLSDVKEDIKSLEYKLEKIEKIDDDSVYLTISNVLDNEETQKVENYFNEKYEATTSVGAVSNKVKKDITKNAIKALIYACIGMIIYVSIRFRFSYAISAIIALIHDSVMVLIAFSLLRFEVNSMFIAAILSIVGYSINNTIVIFDRIRENKTKNYKDKINKSDDLKDIVNTSLSQTVVRCIITTITTLLPVISLIVVGSHEIFNFNIALLIGLVVGTFSSLFISSQIWMLIEKRSIGRDTTKHWYDDAKKKKKEPEELMVKGVNC